MSSLVSGAASIVSQGVQSALTALAQPGLRADDALFVDESVYFFELRFPSSGAISEPGRYYFPLALNPEAISMSEPFSVESTPTMGGGLVVEETGIITRTIRLRGTTGTYQRSFRGDVDQLNLQKTAQRDFGRTLTPQILGVLSGQKLFQYLNDAVFRLYGSLKKDPSTAAKTTLIFHMPRESEAWVVIPTHFGNDRTNSRPLDYPYDIELLVVQRAELNSSEFSRNKPVMDALRDPLKVAANYLQRASAAVNALTAAQGQLRNYFRQLDVVLTQANSVIAAVGSFVTGAADLIAVPASIVRQLAATISNMMATYVGSKDAFGQVPIVYEQSFRQLEAAQHYILLHPGSFAQANAAARQAQQAVLDYNAANEADLLDQARAAAYPVTFAAASKLGTSITPEQVAQVQTSVQAGAAVVAYTGSHPYRIVSGDTLWNLAARFLGDARLWRYIAAVNDLRPPYNILQSQLPLVAQGAPSGVSTLSLGDTILIPDFSTPSSPSADIATLGVPTDSPLDEKVFGRDLALSTTGSVKTNSRSSNNELQQDWVIDPTSGGTALKVASGTDNLTQAVLTRVSLTRGQDPLYDNLGVNALVTSGNSAIDGQTLAFSLRESLAQDPRIDQVQGLTVVHNLSGDGVALTGTVQARNFAEPVPLSIPLTGAQTG